MTGLNGIQPPVPPAAKSHLKETVPYFARGRFFLFRGKVTSYQVLYPGCLSYIESPGVGKVTEKVAYALPLMAVAEVVTHIADD